MKPYTVVLLRPEFMSDWTETEFGQDIYVAFVMANDIADAIRVAKLEVIAADSQEGYEHTPITKLQYKLCVMFEGHQKPVLFGWQPHERR